MSGIALHMYRLSYRVSDLYTLGFGENGLGICLHILTSVGNNGDSDW